MPPKDVLGNVPWEKFSLTHILSILFLGQSTLANPEMGLMLLLKLQHVFIQQALNSSGLCYTLLSTVKAAKMYLGFLRGTETLSTSGH